MSREKCKKISPKNLWVKKQPLMLQVTVGQSVAHEHRLKQFDMRIPGGSQHPGHERARGRRRRASSLQLASPPLATA
jgi:hypothetical protein